MLSLAAQGSSV
uniref:Uncharacterized protein n=1 Tax=Arundo donax TaxID=35708 RepID=A0A0A9F133_ARUDO